MASITSLTSSSSSTSSIYGNRNVISGLASGLDTETLIENSISAYKTKISSLQQQMTKLQWKQEAYRGIITQMNSLLTKYTSYTSSTNLMSPSFFTQAVTTAALGANASKVAVSGKGTSDVSLDRVLNIAKAASYSVGTSDLAANGSATEAIKWDNEVVETSAVEGSIAFRYGGGTTSSGSTFTLRFEEGEVYNTKQELADAINAKLKEKTITSNNGASSADNYIKAQVIDDNVVLTDLKGNNFQITSVSGGMANLFEKTTATGQMIVSKPVEDDQLVNKVDKADYLAGKKLNFTLDGKNVAVDLSFMATDEFKALSNDEKNSKMVEKINEQLKQGFGSDKVQVSIGSNGNLEFSKVASGSTLKVAGSSSLVNNALGLGDGGYSNTLQTSWTVKQVLGSNSEISFEAKKDEEGNFINKDGNVVDSEEKAAKVANLTINGKEIEINEDDTIQELMDKINASDAGVTVKYSTLTGEFAFTSNETGADQKIEITGALGTTLFGDVDAARDGDVEGARYTAGQDAQFTVTVNGKQMTMTRSSNTVDLDGYSVTLKGEFGYQKDEDGNVILDEKGNAKIDSTAEAITFQTSVDSDKIVDAIREFVNDYNTMVTALRSAYTTEPLTNSSGNSYEPLTDDDRSGMSESAIKTYEDNAKTGLLYADQDLSNLYSKLTSVIQGDNGLSSALRSIGLNITYSNQLSTIDLDEDALRSALESDPDKVKNAFSQTTTSGASINGLMANMKSTLEQYANTSIASPGILVNKAGSELSSYSLNNNELNDQIKNLQEQIEKWQDKMSDRVDYYTSQFTRLEVLINQMNSQSSMLAGLTGGY